MRLAFILSVCLVFVFSSGYSHDPATGISTQVFVEPQQSKQVFPLYSSIILVAQGVYAHYNVAKPVWIRVVWWGAFVAEDGGVLDNSIQIRRAFLICNDVNTYSDDCANSIRDAFKSCLMKLIYLLLVNKGHYKPSLVLFAFYILFYLFQNGK